MVCFLCQNEVPDGAQTHLCVKDNSALFKQQRSEVDPAVFTEYTDELDFFDAEQIIEG